MTFEPYTAETMKILLPQIKNKEKYLMERKAEIAKRIKGIEDGSDYQEWIKLAAVAAFPAIDTSKERVDGGSIDTDTLFHQLEQINQLGVQQIELYSEDLKAVSRELLKLSIIQSCILYLMEDSRYITDFYMESLTYLEGCAIFHMSKSAFHRKAMEVLDRFVDICNTRLEKHLG